MNARQFVEKLKSWQSEKEYNKIRKYFKADGEENRIIGVRMKKIFDLAKENTGIFYMNWPNLITPGSGGLPSTARPGFSKTGSWMILTVLPKYYYRMSTNSSKKV